MPLGAVLMSLTGLTAYAVHDALIKHLSQTFSVIQIIFFISLFTFPLISIWLVGSRTTPSLRPNNVAAVSFRAISFVVVVVCAFYGFQVLPLGQAYSLLFTTPLMVTLLSGPMLGERASPAQVAAICVGFLGVLIVLQPTAQPIQLGHISILTAATLSAINAALVRKMGSSERSVILLLYPLITSILAMSLLLPSVYKPMSLGELGLSAVIALLSLVGGVLTIHAFRRGRAAIIAPMQYSQIIWGVIFGALFFDEIPQVHTLIGSSIIIASGIFVVTRERGAVLGREELARRTTQIARINTFLTRKK